MVVFEDGGNNSDDRIAENQDDDGDSSHLVSRLVPALIVVTTALVTLCAVLLCFIDICKRRMFDDEVEKNEAPPDSNRDTSMSTNSTFAGRSCICALTAAQNPVLPPIECLLDEDEGFFDTENALSKVSSMTASLLSQSKTSGLEAIDLEVASHSSLCPPNIVVKGQTPHEESVKGDGDGSLGSTSNVSQDRSGVSALTEDSHDLSEEQSAKPSSEKETTTQNKYSSESSEKTGNAVDTNVKATVDNERDADCDCDRDLDGNESNQIQVEEDKEEATIYVEVDKPVLLPSPAARKCIRGIMLVGSRESLGFETESITTGRGCPVIAHVSDDSPLRGQVFKNALDSEIGHGDEAREDDTNVDRKYDDNIDIYRTNSRDEAPRSIQLTVLSAHDDAVTAEIEDPLELQNKHDDYSLI